MTDVVEVALITGIAAIAVGTIPGTISAISSGRARRAAERAEKSSHEAKDVSVGTANRIDGRMDELLELTRLAAFKAGVLEQKELGQRIASAVKDAQVPTVVIATPQLPPAVQRQERDAEK